jgi:carbon monoxide dehydrogenase subunit G
VLSKSIPVAERLNKIGDGEYDMAMNVGMASISGKFAGKVRIADPNPPQSFRMVVEGTGKIGFVKGEGLINLTSRGESTEVKFDGEVNVGGTIAAVGQRLIDTTSKMIIKKFFDTLAEQAKASPNPAAS